MGDDFSLEDALIILRRRILFFLIPAAAFAALGLAVVMLLPSKYTSEGSILVESAQIPSDMVKSTINTFAQERIEVIKQRVMTREKLLSVADKYEIFPKRANMRPGERVKKMRARLKIEPKKIEGLQTNYQRDNTLWFTVSFTDPSPERALQVANEFMTLVLSEDVRARTASASNTTEFFTQETARLGAEVEKIDGDIKAFKEANNGSLPDYLPLNMEMFERTNDDLSAAQASLNSIDEQIRSSQTLLATVLSGAGEQGGPSQQIAILKTELAQKRSIYQDAHPEIKTLRAQIASLEAQLAPSKEFQRLKAILDAARLDHKSAKATLPEGDPAIAEKKAAIKAAEEALSAQLQKEGAASGGNLMSSQVQATISVLESRRISTEEQIEEMQKKVADLRARIDATPATEAGLTALTSARDNAYKQYQELLGKRNASQISQNLEENQKAEKFSILEAAQLPEKPSSPERVKLGILSLFFAMGAGVAAAGAVEFLTATIRGRAHVSKIVGSDPIAIIPNFEREKQPAPKFFRRKAAATAAAITEPVAGTLNEQPAASGA